MVVIKVEKNTKIPYKSNILIIYQEDCIECIYKMKQI